MYLATLCLGPPPSTRSATKLCTGPHPCRSGAARTIPTGRCSCVASRLFRRERGNRRRLYVSYPACSTNGTANAACTSTSLGTNTAPQPAARKSAAAVVTMARGDEKVTTRPHFVHRNSSPRKGELLCGLCGSMVGSLHDGQTRKWPSRTCSCSMARTVPRAAQEGHSTLPSSSKARMSRAILLPHWLQRGLWSSRYSFSRWSSCVTVASVGLMAEPFPFFLNDPRQQHGERVPRPRR